MHEIINKENLKNCFNFAIKENKKFIGLLIAMDGFDKPEIIINTRENFEKKFEYYDKTYDDNLEHRFAKGIKIIGYATGINFEKIEKNLLGIGIKNKGIEIDVELKGTNTIKYDLEEIKNAVIVINEKYDKIIEKQNKVKSKVALSNLGI